MDRQADRQTAGDITVTCRSAPFLFEDMGKIAMQGPSLRFFKTMYIGLQCMYAIDFSSMEIHSDLREQRVKTFSENMFLKTKNRV